mgnify:CR=1 FL=1
MSSILHLQYKQSCCMFSGAVLHPHLPSCTRHVSIEDNMVIKRSAVMYHPVTQQQAPSASIRLGGWVPSLGGGGGGGGGARHGEQIGCCITCGHCAAGISSSLQSDTRGFHQVQAASQDRGNLVLLLLLVVGQGPPSPVAFYVSPLLPDRALLLALIVFQGRPSCVAAAGMVCWKQQLLLLLMVVLVSLGHGRGEQATASGQLELISKTGLETELDFWASNEPVGATFVYVDVSAKAERFKYMSADILRLKILASGLTLEHYEVL